jgi:hypothetical protein
MTMTDTRTTDRPYTDVLTAALRGGEDDVIASVTALDRRGRARLLNALDAIRREIVLRDARLAREQDRG